MNTVNRWDSNTGHHPSYRSRLLTMAFKIALLPMCLLALPLSAAQTGTATQQADYQQKMQTAQKNIDKLKAELKQVVASKSTLEAKLARNEKKMGDLNKKIRDVKGALAAEKKQLALLNEQRVDLMQSLNTQQAQLEQLLVAVYRQHRSGSPLSLNLSPSERSKRPRLMHYQKVLAVQQYQQLSKLQTKEQEILAISSKAEKYQQALEDRKKQLTSQKSALAKSQKERSKLVKSLTQKASSNSKRLQKAQRERESLAKVIATIEKELALSRLKKQSIPFRKQRGKLLWPTQGKVKHSFGSPRRPTGKWDGVWISASQSASVKSVHSGRVVFADWLRGFGLLVIVDHGDGFMSLYGHNESLDVAIGDSIKAHQTIARAGNSGGKEDIGLYFSIRHRGKPQDPAKWCS